MMPLAEMSCQLARFFISAGADVDAINKEGHTPIMVAILQVSFHLCHPNCQGCSVVMPTIIQKVVSLH